MSDEQKIRSFAYNLLDMLSNLGAGIGLLGLVAVFITALLLGQGFNLHEVPMAEFNWPVLNKMIGYGLAACYLGGLFFAIGEIRDNIEPTWLDSSPSWRPSYVIKRNSSGSIIKGLLLLTLLIALVAAIGFAFGYLVNLEWLIGSFS